MTGITGNKRRWSFSSLLSDSEGMAVCEIIHTRSESEGRPERIFQLCCRYVLEPQRDTWPSIKRQLSGDVSALFFLFLFFVQPAVLQTPRRTS